VCSLSVAFDPESAADAVQEAFLAAARRWSRVSAYDEPATWIRRVAINRLLNGKRNDRRRAEILATVRPAVVEGMNFRRARWAMSRRRQPRFPVQAEGGANDPVRVVATFLTEASPAGAGCFVAVSRPSESSRTRILGSPVRPLAWTGGDSSAVSNGAIRNNVNWPPNPAVQGVQLRALGTRCPAGSRPAFYTGGHVR
jgi:Sigma-70 region 2